MIKKPVGGSFSCKYPELSRISDSKCMLVVILYLE